MNNILPFSLSCGLYYKHITIVNDDSSVISKWVESLIDDARVVIYNCNMFKIQAKLQTRYDCKEQLKCHQ